jgi:hypothetical protein
MTELVKVENDSLARDINTNAILETDAIKLKRYRNLKRGLIAKDKRMDELLDRINKLEQTINAIGHNV